MSVNIFGKAGEAAQTGCTLQVIRYSKRAVGGPFEALIQASGERGDLQDLLHWVGRCVEITSRAGRLVWWGFIERVEVCTGEISLTADLGQMANRVAAAYTGLENGQTGGLRGTTGWAEDPASTAAFGIKELLVSAGGVGAVGAEQIRERVLQARYAPLAKVSAAAGERGANLICKGWWSTLAWRYASVPVQLALGYETIGGQEVALGRAETLERTGVLINAGAAGMLLRSIELPAARQGLVADRLRVNICQDAGGAPGAVLKTATLEGSELGEDLTWARFRLAAVQALIPGLDYWLVIDRTSSAGRDHWYELGAASAGTHAESYLSGAWEIAGGGLAYRLLDESDALLSASEGIDGSLAVGKLATVTGAAQSFETGSSPIHLQQVSIYAAKFGDPRDHLKAAIWSCGADGTPEAELVSANLDGTALNSSGGWLTAWVDEYELEPMRTYFLMLTRSGSPERVNYYPLRLDEHMGYGGGTLALKLGADWEDIPADLPFELYDNALIETSQQVKSLLTGCGQFLRRVVTETSSGVRTESYRDGDTTALYEVEKLLRAGTSGGRRMLAEVRPDRSVRIFEQPGEDECWSVGGDWRDPLHQVVSAEDCPVGFFARAAGAEGLGAASLSGLQPFFVEEMTYESANDRLAWRSGEERGAGWIEG